MPRRRHRLGHRDHRACSDWKPWPWKPWLCWIIRGYQRVNAVWMVGKCWKFIYPWWLLDDGYWWMISKWSANDHLILEWTFVGLSAIVQPWGYQQTGDGQLVGPKMGHEGVTIGPSNSNWMVNVVNVTENTSNSWFPGPIASTITWLFPNFLADFFGCSLQHMTKPTQMRQKHFLTQKRYWKSGF